jgi:hypothetical protein
VPANERAPLRYGAPDSVRNYIVGCELCSLQKSACALRYASRIGDMLRGGVCARRWRPAESSNLQQERMECPTTTEHSWKWQ